MKTKLELTEYNVEIEGEVIIREVRDFTDEKITIEFLMITEGKPEGRNERAIIKFGSAVYTKYFDESVLKQASVTLRTQAYLFLDEITGV